jgi:hypothetical protein
MAKSIKTKSKALKKMFFRRKKIVWSETKIFGP